MTVAMRPVVHKGFPARGVVAGGAAVTIGVFDGVHLGHQRLLQQTVAHAGEDGTAVMVTFEPHPRCVVDPSGCPPMLSTVDERAALAARHGVSATVELAFTRDFSGWSAERFCDRLVESMHVRQLVVGPGFRLGHGRAGDDRFLRAYGAAHGFDVAVVAPVKLGDEPVSSGRVRAAVLAGNPDEAAALLGRSYRLRGTVVHGNGRGRTLGFPTANIAVGSSRCVPAHGVYATWLLAGERWVPAATSIGVRPTFGAGARTIEAHALDDVADLYGTEVRLDIVARLRDEIAFGDADSLIIQMHRDVDDVRRLMEGMSPPQPVP